MNDNYCYPNSNVLINKFDLRDKESLEEMELQTVNSNLILVKEKNITFPKMSVDSLKGLHKILFQDIYEWAGQYRKISFIKYERVLSGASVEYAPQETIDKRLEDISEIVNNMNWNTSNNQIILDNIIKTLVDIWEVHPFREGNTRTTVLYLQLFLKGKNIDFDTKILKENSQYVRDSLVLATYDESNYLIQIIKNALVNDSNNEVFERIRLNSEYEVKTEDYYSKEKVEKLNNEKHK